MSDDKPQVSGAGAPESPSETPEGKPPQGKTPQAEAPTAESAAPAKSAAKGAPKKRKRWGRRLVLALPVLAVSYVVFGFLGVPLVVRHVGLPMAKKYFAGDIEIEAIRFNPLTFVAGADGIVVTDPGDPGEPIAKVDGFAADFDLWSVFKGEPTVSYIRVDGPSARAVMREDGSINLLSLLTLPESDEEPGEPPNITIAELTVTGAGATWEDRTHTPPTKAAVSDVNVRVAGFNLRRGGAAAVDLVIDEVAKVALVAQVAPSRPAVELQSLSIEGLAIAPYGGYAAAAPVKVTAGTVDVSSLRAAADLGVPGPIPPATVSGVVKVTGLAAVVGDGLAEVEGLNLTLPIEGVSTTDWSVGLGQIVLEIARAEATLPTPPEVDPDAVQEPQTEAGQAEGTPSLIVRDESGRLIIPGLPETLAVDLAGVEVSIETLMLRDGAAGEDVPVEAAGMPVRDLTVSVGSWSTSSDDPLTLKVMGDLPEAGVAWVDGSFELAQDLYDSVCGIDVRVRALPLPRFREAGLAWAGIGFDKGWMDLDVNVKVEDGRATVPVDAALHKLALTYSENGPLPAGMLNSLEVMRQMFDPAAALDRPMRLSTSIALDLRDPSVSMGDLPGMLAETLLASLLNTGASLADGAIEGLAGGASAVGEGALGAAAGVAGLLGVDTDEQPQTALTPGQKKAVVFEPGGTTPVDEALAMRVARHHAEALKADESLRLLVVGLVDPGVEGEGEDAALAESRAAAVRDAIVAEGVSEDRVRARGEVSHEGAGPVARIRPTDRVAPIGGGAP